MPDPRNPAEPDDVPEKDAPFEPYPDRSPQQDEPPADDPAQKPA